MSSRRWIAGAQRGARGRRLIKFLLGLHRAGPGRVALMAYRGQYPADHPIEVAKETRHANVASLREGPREL